MTCLCNKIYRKEIVKKVWDHVSDDRYNDQCCVVSCDSVIMRNNQGALCFINGMLSEMGNGATYNWVGDDLVFGKTHFLFRLVVSNF